MCVDKLSHGHTPRQTSKTIFGWNSVVGTCDGCPFIVFQVNARTRGGRDTADQTEKAKDIMHSEALTVSETSGEEIGKPRETGCQVGIK